MEKLLANMIPVLFTTYNRLEFTKKSLSSLLKSDCGQITIVDNNSTDGTAEWLGSLPEHEKIDTMIFCEYNSGIAGAMNFFMERVQYPELVAKVDNDTIVPPNLFSILSEKIHSCNLDMIQARHPILKQTYPTGFDEWMKTLKQDEKDKSIFYNNYIGGSGIVFRRNVVSQIPETKWMLYGWNQFQKNHPRLRKAFTNAVSIELLDMKPEGGSDYSAYPEYYVETGRT